MQNGGPAKLEFSRKKINIKKQKCNFCLFKKYLNFRAKIFYYFQKNNADVIVLYENGTIYDGHMEKYSSP